MKRLREETNELVPGVQDDRRHLLRSHFIEPSYKSAKEQTITIHIVRSVEHATLTDTHTTFYHKTVHPHKCKMNNTSVPYSSLPHGTKNYILLNKISREKL
jgi:hypothetical protein